MHAAYANTTHTLLSGNCTPPPPPPASPVDQDSETLFSIIGFLIIPRIRFFSRVAVERGKRASVCIIKILQFIIHADVPFFYSVLLQRENKLSVRSVVEQHFVRNAISVSSGTFPFSRCKRPPEGRTKLFSFIHEIEIGPRAALHVRPFAYTLISHINITYHRRTALYPSFSSIQITQSTRDTCLPSDTSRAQRKKGTEHLTQITIHSSLKIPLRKLGGEIREPTREKGREEDVRYPRERDASACK